MLPIVHSDEYIKYNFGVGHPLIPEKPSELLKFLLAKVRDVKVFIPEPINGEYLFLAHSIEYIRYIKKLSECGGILALDTPAPKGIYDVAKHAVGGTTLACELTNRYGMAVHTFGGFHHACIASASGFCFLNDIAIAVLKLRKEHKLKKFAIIDLDVHHCNGTEEIFYNDPNTLVISLHQDGRTLYPGTGFIEDIGEGDAKNYNINIPLPPGTTDEDYLYAFDSIVPKVVMKYAPELTIIEMGTDTHWQDPLANLKLTLNAYYKLGCSIKNICEKIVVICGGGYNLNIAIKGCYNIIAGMLNLEPVYEDVKFESKLKSEIEKIVQKVLNNLTLTL